MKWIALEEKYGLLDEPIKTYLNPLQVTSIKFVPDQGVSIIIASSDIPYILPCSSSVGTKIVSEVIDFTTNKQKRKPILDLEELKNQFMKEDLQSKENTNKHLKHDDDQTSFDF